MGNIAKMQRAMLLHPRLCRLASTSPRPRATPTLDSASPIPARRLPLARPEPPSAAPPPRRAGPPRRPSSSGPRGFLYSPPPPEALSRAWAPPEADVVRPRSLRVAIVGEPNAGKSTLLNALLGAPVSAVSRKFNTTRDRVLGVLTEGEAQVALTDTPGFALPGAEGRGRYQRTLVAEARAAVPRSDLVLMVVDLAKRMSPGALQTMEDMAALCARSGAPLVLLANKCDLLRGVRLSAEQAAIAAAGGGGGGGGARDLLGLKLGLLEEWFEGAAARVGLLGVGGFDAGYMWLPEGAGDAVADPDCVVSDEAE